MKKTSNRILLESAYNLQKRIKRIEEVLEINLECVKQDREAIELLTENNKWISYFNLAVLVWLIALTIVVLIKGL